jgi:hypothetical protein
LVKAGEQAEQLVVRRRREDHVVERVWRAVEAKNGKPADADLGPGDESPHERAVSGRQLP